MPKCVKTLITVSPKEGKDGNRNSMISSPEVSITE